MSFENKVKELALKHALLNAVKHNGKAILGPVVSKIVAEFPEVRSKIKEVIPLIKSVIEEVNKMSLEEQRSLLLQKWPEVLEVEAKVQAPKELPPLPNVEKYKRVVTRFAPNPDFVLTIGNARAAILSYKYAELYKGIFILRFEDTDPRTKKPIKEAYELIKEDLKWLGIKWDYEYIQSLRIPIYYYYARKLIELGGAYICTHGVEELRKLRAKGVRCECANLSIEDQLERWDRMLEGYYSEGEAVYRVKTDPNYPDPSVRDWIAFRIIDTSKYPHPLVGDKYIVWPTYNFAAAVDDHLMGVTHILRAKEHITNTIKQKFLYQHFGWEYPETIHFGRLKLEGVILSKSKMRKGIEEGRYLGWDDPRLGTLIALRRRGFNPKTIWDIMLDMGVKESEATLSLKNIYAVNRKYIEPVANRYMFVDNPTKVQIEINNTITAKVPYHPSFPERGFRKITLEPENGVIEVFITKHDFNKLNVGDEIRLMGLANVKVLEKTDKLKVKILSFDAKEARRKKLNIIQWVPKDNVKVMVLKPEGDELKQIKGFAEPEVGKLKVNEIVQFYRFGFVKVESKESEIINMIYLHD